MIPITLAEIVQVTDGKIENAENCNKVITSVSTDTRFIEAGALFIALKGDRFDAHQFLDQAASAGASVLLVEQINNSKLPCIVVKDTRIALGLLSAYVKRQITGLQSAAITGSNGKTTTKELLTQILVLFSETDGAVLSTAGNFNNDIGVPLTLLRLSRQNSFAVIELGANHIGEIAYTAQLLKPDVALINNVMPAHLEGFGSIEGVAQAKGEIWDSLDKNGTGVVNLDADFADDYLKRLNELQCRILTFSQMDKSADLFASNICFDLLGRASFTLNLHHKERAESVNVQLNLAGKHNISNALAAACMAIALGCSLAVISRGLNLLQAVKGRVNYSSVNKLITVIDDTYNANSASVKAAVDLLAQQCEKSEESLLILADMGELGVYSEQEHGDIGSYAAKAGIGLLLTVGPLSLLTQQSFQYEGGKQSKHFADKKLLKKHLQKILVENRKKLTILVKGSRSAKMEEIVEYIKSNK